MPQERRGPAEFRLHNTVKRLPEFTRAHHGIGGDGRGHQAQQSQSEGPMQEAGVSLKARGRLERFLGNQITTNSPRTQAIADAAAVKEIQRRGLRSGAEYREATDVFERQLIGPYIDNALAISPEKDIFNLRIDAAMQAERDLDDIVAKLEEARIQTSS